MPGDGRGPVGIRRSALRSRRGAVGLRRKRINQNDIGRLVGFRSDYPWTHIGRGEGIRTRAQQAADVVCPMTAAAVIGRILNPHSEEQTRTYVTELYGTAETA